VSFFWFFKTLLIQMVTIEVNLVIVVVVGGVVVVIVVVTLTIHCFSWVTFS